MVRHYAVTAVQKSGVEVEYRLAANPPFAAHGHDGRYGQVFRNVIDNALSFSPPGSRIVVELSREPRGGPFVVTIDDEGHGIPEEQPRIDLPALLLGAPDRAFRPAFGIGPVDLPADHGDLRRLDHGLQSPRCRRSRAGRALHHSRAGRRRQVMSGMTTLVHATCVALRPRGRSWRAVLLRGPSGAGKSDLALRLIERAPGWWPTTRPRLSAGENPWSPARRPSIAGLIEARGVGIVKLARDQLVARAPVVLLVDLAPPERIERLPETAQESLLGVDLPVLVLAPFEASASAKLRLALTRIAVA